MVLARASMLRGKGGYSVKACHAPFDRTIQQRSLPDDLVMPGSNNGLQEAQIQPAATGGKRGKYKKGLQAE